MMFHGDVGAEDFGPQAPTSTQVAVQTARNVLTSEVPLTPNTFYIMVGGALAIYLAYTYWYREA